MKRASFGVFYMIAVSPVGWALVGSPAPGKFVAGVLLGLIWTDLERLLGYRK